MIKYFFKYFLFFISIFIFIDCANVGAPSGGPKDTQAPVVISSYPKNESVNFNDKKIKIDFDEYIKLKNLNKNLIISPPLNKKPDVKIKNKSLIISIKDSLQKNTTYTFNFNDAIVDINEGNPKSNFKFVFSTGNIIDSLKISGQILNAFDLTPAKNIFVFLYKNTNDTMPLKQKPYYITKTNKTGNFEFTNIAKSNYMIFALDDKNSNFIFDSPSENIAFSDTLIKPDIKIIEKIDTIKTDTLQNDSIVVFKLNKYLPNNIKMFLFNENQKKQFLVSAKRVSKEKLILIFNKTLKTTPLIKLLNNSNKNCFIIDTNATNDTLNVWITDSLAYNADTIHLLIKHEITDSLQKITLKTDTFELTKPTYLKNGEQKFNNNLSKTSFSINVKNKGILDIYKNINISLNTPIKQKKINKIYLYQKKDTSFIKINPKIFEDSLNKQKIVLKNKWEESGNYKLVINDSCFCNIYNACNKSNTIYFSVTKFSDYGNLKITLDSINNKNIILQLLDSKKNIVKIYFTNTNNSFNFLYLKPGKYYLKAIFDSNNNKKWDTGNYKNKIQPERIKFFDKEINIRANWDVEETFEL